MAKYTYLPIKRVNLILGGKKPGKTQQAELNDNLSKRMFQVQPKNLGNKEINEHLTTFLYLILDTYIFIIEAGYNVAGYKSEAVAQRCSLKKVVLKNFLCILRNLQYNFFYITPLVATFGKSISRMFETYLSFDIDN